MSFDLLLYARHRFRHWGCSGKRDIGWGEGCICTNICIHAASYMSQRRQWHPTPVLLPGKSHGQRSLVGYSPWDCEESDMTERLQFHALEKEMATHSSVLARRIPGTGERGGLPSMGSHRVEHDWSDLAAAAEKFIVHKTVSCLLKHFKIFFSSFLPCYQDTAFPGIL